MAITRYGEDAGGSSSATVSVELAAHIADTVDAHDASAVSFTPGGSVAATDVQTAIAEVATDYIAADVVVAATVSAHLADTSAAHAASAISADSTTLVGVGTDVQAVLEELDNGIADHLGDTTDAHNATAIGFTPASGIAATTVASALAEIGDTIGSEGAIGFRNRIHNGDMRIDVRRAGAATTINSTTHIQALDRWCGYGEPADGLFTMQQLSASPPNNYTHYLRCSVSTADASLSASQGYGFMQIIEGNDIADLGWGTANAKAITLSFWFRSSLTGTFGGSIRNSAQDYSYPFSFTVSSANTWEYKTVTIAGPTAGTWLTDTGRGMSVLWDLGAGSTYRGTAGAWTAAYKIGVTGAVSPIATLSSTVDITGVQVEVGSVATPFARRPIAVERAICQRYYENGGVNWIFSGDVTNTKSYYVNVQFKQVKRIAGATVTFADQGSVGFAAGVPIVGGTVLADMFIAKKDSNATTTGAYYSFSWTAEAEF